MSPIETLARDILNSTHTPEAHTLRDLGVISPTELSMLCLQIDDEESVNIHAGEISPATTLDELRRKVEERKFGNYWSRGGNIQTYEPVCFPYAGLIPVFTRPASRAA